MFPPILYYFLCLFTLLTPLWSELYDIGFTRSLACPVSVWPIGLPVNYPCLAQWLAAHLPLSQSRYLLTPLYTTVLTLHPLLSIYWVNLSRKRGMDRVFQSLAGLIKGIFQGQSQREILGSSRVSPRKTLSIPPFSFLKVLQLFLCLPAINKNGPLQPALQIIKQPKKIDSNLWFFIWSLIFIRYNFYNYYSKHGASSFCSQMMLDLALYMEVLRCQAKQFL